MGSERPAAHTQQKLTQITRPPGYIALYSWSNKTFIALCEISLLLYERKTVWIILASCVKKGAQALRRLVLLAIWEQTRFILFRQFWYLFGDPNVSFYIIILIPQIPLWMFILKELLSTPWLKFWVVAKEYIPLAPVINLMIENYVQNLANKRR